MKKKKNKLKKTETSGTKTTQQLTELHTARKSNEEPLI